MAEKRYVRPTVGGWLGPVLIAPWLVTYGLIALDFFLLPHGGFLGPWPWLVSALGFGTAVTFLHVAALVTSDLLLLGVRVRSLPVGRAAWGMAAGSTAALYVLYRFVVSPIAMIKLGPWVAAAAFLLPPIVAACGTRVAAGAKIARGPR